MSNVNCSGCGKLIDTDYEDPRYWDWESNYVICNLCWDDLGDMILESLKKKEIKYE